MTTAAPGVVEFLHTHRVRLTAGAVSAAILIYLFTGVDPSVRAVMLLLLLPMLGGSVFVAISSAEASEWVNAKRGVIVARGTRAHEKDSKYARYFRRPLWTGSLALWNKTESIEDPHVRAGIRATIFAYFAAVMVFLLVMTVYIIVGLVVAALMFWLIGWFMGWSGSATGYVAKRSARRLYNKHGAQIGEKLMTTDMFGKPLVERFDAMGRKIGESRLGSDLLGGPKTEHYDESGRMSAVI